jgi:serine/threonine-protein kinase
MDFQLGQTYSSYEFLDILKRTRDGVEYRVRNAQAGRLEALRALPENAQDDPERAERFVREMRVHASLVHPNIVALFSASELDNHLVMTRELVDGPTLADKLQLGPLPWEEAVAFTRQAASALAYAHEQKVVHRDICPDNITITPEGLLKLANFTLAKAASSPKLTQVGMAIGNLKYISPEQIKGVADLDGRSDIYSLGMVLYEMLCGRPAFDFESQFELMAAQVNQVPRAPHEVSWSVPKEIGAVVLKALAKDRAERYQTAAEFDQALVEATDRARSGKGEAERVSPPSFVQSIPRMSIELVPDPVLAAAALHRSEPELLAENAPNFLAAEEEDTAFSRKFILIGGAAGAFVGAVLMSIWLIMR